jgi:hypothetical protein
MALVSWSLFVCLLALAISICPAAADQAPAPQNITCVLFKERYIVILACDLSNR